MIFIFIQKIVVGANQSNCYLVGEKEGKIAVIDPGAEGQKILKEVEAVEGEISYIINTHGHFDHIGANKFIKENSKGELMIHWKEEEYLFNPEINLSRYTENEVISPPADSLLEDNNTLEIGGYIFQIFLTPGHSPGGISLYCKEEDVIFSGDTIFANGIGRADLPGSNKSVLERSIESKLLKLGDETVVYPGHGDKTIIGQFKENIWSSYH